MALVVLNAAAVLVAACDEDDLSITITAEYDSLEPGAQITYTITITTLEIDGSQSTDVEATPSAATAFLAGPSSAEWNEEVGVLRTGAAFSFGAVGDTVTKVLKLVVQVKEPLTEDVILDAKLIDIQGDEDGNRTIVDRDESEGDDSNNAASLTIEIIDVGVTTEIISGDPSDPRPGDVIVYQHTVTNHLTGSVETVLSDVVPPGTTFFFDESDTNWICPSGAAAGTVCTRPFPLSSSVASFSAPFAVRVNGDHPARDPILNFARLPIKGDINPFDNVSPLADLGIREIRAHSFDTRTPLSLEEGHLILWFITIANPAPVPQSGAVQSSLDPNTTFRPTFD